MPRPSPRPWRGRVPLLVAATGGLAGGCDLASARPASPADGARTAATADPGPGTDADTATGTGTETDTPTDTATETPTDTAATDTAAPVSAPLQGMVVAQSWDHRDRPLGPGAGQFRVVFLQESMHSLLPELRAANPGALHLAYQKAGGMRADGGDHASTGLRLDQADGHEGWFLHDAAGQRLEYCDYPGVWAANIGDPGYQAAWLAAVQERVTRDGFDGVMLDDVNTFPGHCLGERGTAIAEYPTDAAYGEAVVAFMRAVGPGLQEAGLAVAPNIALNPWTEVQRDQALAMLPAITHWGREYWMRWDDSANFRGDEWSTTLALMVAAQEAGVGFFALTRGPGAEGAAAGKAYGRASFLLAWDGVSDSAWGYDEGGSHDSWDDDQAPVLGLPTGPATAAGQGWQRAYEGGMVLINPAPEGDQDFALDRAVVAADGTAQTRLRLAAGSAALLPWAP